MKEERESCCNELFLHTRQIEKAQHSLWFVYEKTEAYTKLDRKYAKSITREHEQIQILTGILSLTSHKRNELSVDAEASSLLDKNFTYETDFLCPVKICRGWLIFLKS